jgi:serine/threonine-protein kinase HipA
MRSRCRDRYHCETQAPTLSALSVWIEGIDFPVGRLDYADSGRQSIFFAYADQWLAEAAAFPISLSLPLEDGAHDDSVSRAFFNNLLQENDQLDRLLRREGLERSNIIGILRHLGADCAGALSCLPAGAPPVKKPGNLATDYDLIDHENLSELVRRLAAGQSLPEPLRDPSPVAGYRRKISLAMTEQGQFAVPKAGLGVPTTHILKIPDPGHRYEAQQEAAAARLASACGLPAARSIALPIDGQDIILIERFDRYCDEAGNVFRLHQEDFAQALGLPSEFKYQRRAVGRHRFDAAGIAKILSQTEAPALARERFLQITLFNLLMGNSDNHAKNHALLYAPGRRPVLAPLYDIVPIQLGDGYTDEFAFNIGKAARATELTADDLAEFCAALGFPPSRSKEVVREQVLKLIAKLEPATNELIGELKIFDMLIGREMNRFCALMGVESAIRERDYLPEGRRNAGGWVLS